MNRDEQEQFIDKQVRGLWPQWKPTDAEIAVWMRELAAFDLPLARRAVQAYYAEQMVHAQRPLLGRFLAQARALTRPAHRCCREPSDLTTGTFLECFQPPEGKPYLKGVRKPVYVWPLSRQSDPDYVSACAGSMRKHFDRLYGGHWIVVRTGVPDLSLDKTAHNRYNCCGPGTGGTACTRIHHG